MTNLLSITARPGAPVACDLTGADETLAERLAEYRGLFDRALVGRDSTEETATFRLAALPGVADQVLDLVRREAACCSFLSYEVDVRDGLVLWTISGRTGTSDVAFLEELLTASA